MHNPATAPAHSPATVPVWDIGVRLFHWSLVALFAFSWFSADDFHKLHRWSGYTITALLGLRVLWGLVGTKYARFSDCIYAPAAIKDYLLSLSRGQPRHYLGHNPAGGAMVIALLLSLSLLALSGMSLAAADGHGPLAGTFVATFSEHDMEEVHEFFANLMLVLIGVHVTGVILSSRAHKENLVRAMVTGRKSRRD
jgi:cytochrome b